MWAFAERGSVPGGGDSPLPLFRCLNLYPAVGAVSHGQGALPLAPRQRTGPLETLLFTGRVQGRRTWSEGVGGEASRSTRRVSASST